MDTGWVRLSRKCNNACVFCLDADQLDGTEVSLEQIKADIDAVAASGAEKVVLSGGEPTMSRHLLAAIRYAAGKGLYTSMTTNGRVLGSDKIVQMLEKAGLKELRVSVHSGRRSTHDVLAGKKGAWVQGLAGLRFACRTKMRVVMVSVLTKPNDADLGHLMHLGTMAGIAEHQLRWLRMEGSARKKPQVEEIPIGRRGALRLMSSLWYDAKEEVIFFSQDGFTDSIDLGLIPEDAECHQADRAGLQMLRERAALHHASQGFSVLDEDGMAKNFVLLVQAEGDLAEVGLELAAHTAPIVDMPVCIGGLGNVPVDHWGDAVKYGEDCDACPMRSSCAGVPRKLRKILGNALRPLPAWQGLGASPEVVVLPSGHDALLDGVTLPELVEKLTAAGARARMADVDADDWSGADAVVCGSPEVAARVTARERREDQVVHVLDTTWARGLAEVQGPVQVHSFGPGRVDLVRAAGRSLRDVSWMPYPVPAAAIDQGATPQGAGIVALGETADWATLEKAMDLSTGKLPVLWAFGPGSERLKGRSDTRVYGEVADEELFQAILSCSAVVLPHARPEDDEAGRRATTRDLRWLAVAAAAGKPVVAIRGPGVADHVRHDQSGLMVPPGAARELADAMRRVAHEQGRIARYRQGARDLGKKSSTDAWCARILQGARPTRSKGTKWRKWPAW